MKRGALILTYHAVERGPAPLCIEPRLFRSHLDCLLECNIRVLKVSELAAALSAGGVPERAVAITFDDGFESVVLEAAPLLAERALPATLFCVAGYLGRTNDWPTQAREAPRLALAEAHQLSRLTQVGIEVGSHGVDHTPLDVASEAVARREVLESKRVLEEATGGPVSVFAYPYGAGPAPIARSLVEGAYAAACGTRVATVRADDDLYLLPRVDAHYLRRPQLLRRALTGSLGPYLSVRRIASRGRRALRKDYAEVGRP